MNKNMKEKIGESLLILATGLFIIGAVGYITGYLEPIPAIGASALAFVGIGAGMKKMK